MDIRTIFKMSNETYDRLKWLALVGLPGLAFLYTVFAEALGFPIIEPVVRIIAGIGTVLGFWLGISSLNYHKEIEYHGPITEEDQENE